MACSKSPEPLKRRQSCDEPPFMSGNVEFRVLVFGRSGCSQFLLTNTILQTVVFDIGVSSIAESQKHKGVVFDKKITVVNTPNLSEDEASQKELKREFKRAMCMTSPGPYVFLFALDLDNISPSAIGLLELVTQNFGEKVLNHVMIVVCHQREDMDSAFHERITTNRDFRELIEKCGRRFHLLNESKARRDENISRQLLEKIDSIVRENGGQFYSNHRYEEAEEKIQNEERFMMKSREKEVVKKRKELESLYSGAELEKEVEQFEAAIRAENREKAERKISEVLGFTFRVVDYAAVVGKAAGVGALCGVPFGFEGMAVGATVGAIVGCVVGGAARAAWGYLETLLHI